MGSGRAVDGAAAGRGRRRRLRGPRRLRRRRPRQRRRRGRGPSASYRVEERDVYEGIDERDLDRIVLDLPEPWRVLAHAPRRCAREASCCPTCRRSPRWPRCAAAWRRSGFGMAETSEVLRRTWHVEERSVRPDHRMVAHTGFLTTARLLVPASDEGRARWGEAAGSQPCSMKMHSPGHSSAASATASSRSSGTSGQCRRPARLVVDLVAFFDVGEAVVEQGEDGRRDLLAQAVAGAQILVDPDLHELAFASPRSRDAAAERTPRSGVNCPVTVATGSTPLSRCRS